MKNLECKYFNICGGCKLLNVEYENQLKQKQQHMKKELLQHAQDLVIKHIIMI